jgi:hypothetical protein
MRQRAIWPPGVMFYMLSLQAISLSAMSSLERVGHKLKEIEATATTDPLSDLEEVELLNELQNFILQAGAISRYFWPVKKSHDWRGSDLRRRLKISDESPLRSRDLRNEIEHFDERLDIYLENGIVGNILPQYVGPEPGTQEVPLHIFRAYYFDKGIFHLLGKRHEIIPLAREVNRIHSQLLASTKPNA